MESLTSTKVGMKYRIAREKKNISELIDENFVFFIKKIITVKRS